MAANAALTKSWYQYVSTDGTTYRILLADYIATQLDGGSNSIIGAVAAAQSLPRWSQKRKARRALLRGGTPARDREQIVCTPTAPIITVPLPAGAGTLNFNNAKTLVQDSFTYSGHFLNEYIGEAKP